MIFSIQYYFEITFVAFSNRCPTSLFYSVHSRPIAIRVYFNFLCYQLTYLTPVNLYFELGFIYSFSKLCLSFELHFITKHGFAAVKL